jgi:mRNA interferase RelE/StbE
VKILIDRSFQKDIDEITDKKLLKSIAQIIMDVRLVSAITEINNLKKLKGSNIAYRIRIGHYRIGLIYENQTIYFIRCLHRKDIYKFFPGQK